MQSQHAAGMVESLACCAQYSEDALATEQPQSQAAAAAYAEVRFNVSGELEYSLESKTSVTLGFVWHQNWPRFLLSPHKLGRRMDPNAQVSSY